MEFSTLTTYLQKLDVTASRIEITKILSDFFKKTTAKEIDKAVYLILGTLAPGFSGLVFNMAERMVVKAIAEASGVGEDLVTAKYKEVGDMGNVAEQLVTSDKGQGTRGGVSVTEVYQKLLEIAGESGEDSVERKVTKTSELLQVLEPESAKYVVRIMLGKLRLGFSDKTILDALSWMETGDKSKKKHLEEAYNILPDPGLLAKEVKEMGIDKATKNIDPKLFIPLLPMLCSRVKSPDEMIEKMGTVYVEPKVDGLRIQIHYKRSLASSAGKKSEGLKAYTRNLRETSWMFPELGGIGKYIKAKEIILDTEAVGVDEERKAMANFQTTMTRRRKHDIEEIAAKVSIKFNIFDIMYVDGKSLVYEPYEDRRIALAKYVSSGDLLRILPFEETQDPKVIIRLMEKNLKEGLEGVVVKKKDGQYIAGRTGYRWVKMKEKESQKAKLADTLDVVVMGYYKGRGKRNIFGIGGFLVGVPSKDKILSFTKIGTGLTDKQFRELKERLKKLETPNKPKEYGEVAKILTPDVWVSPSQVVEIAADEITESPNHSSGYAVRFPRLVKFRDDKNADQATSASEIANLFKIQ